MAKSVRSKTKRAFRRLKRQTGVFAAADAARLERLSAKLRTRLGTDQEGDVTQPEVLEKTEGGEPQEDVSPDATASGESMELDNSGQKKISTSGRRLSRRESWRLSKGKQLQRKNPNKTNRLGVVVAKRRAGRPKRRR